VTLSVLAVLDCELLVVDLSVRGELTRYSKLGNTRLALHSHILSKGIALYKDIHAKKPCTDHVVESGLCLLCSSQP
jgi:hypothetical protein